METRLRLICDISALVNIDSDVDAPLYRYFSSEAAARNSKKETWVPGVNQNRYCHPDSDPNEYFYCEESVRNGALCQETSVIIGREGLSFTANPPERWKALYPDKEHYWIKIDDIAGYAKTLQNDCLNNQHIISWLDKGDLLKKAISSNNTNQITAVRMIPNDTAHLTELNLIFLGLHIRKPLYDGTAFGKDVRFEHQCETRIEFCWHTGFGSDEARPEPLLFHLVEYYKFKTPNISKYYSSIGKI